MVTSLWSDLRAGLRADLAGVRRAFRGEVAGPPSGLRTYRFDRHGGTTVLHLRIQEDGSGLLFRDVTDVIHLTATASEMVWLALEGTTERRAVRQLATRWHASREQLTASYRGMQKLVDALSDPRAACRTCAADLPKVPLFSTRALAPHKVDVALTYSCNNDCPHCYNDPDRFDLGSLPTEQWRAVLDRLAEVGVPHIIFTGGEASLHPGLPELVRHAKSLGQTVGLNTNARRFAKGDYAARLADAGLDHVQVTLESNRAEIHDAMVAANAFRQTVAGIEAAFAAGLHTITNTTITRLNADHLEETIAFLHELGIRTFAMNGMIHSGGGDANPDALPPEAYPPILVRVREAAEELEMKFLWYTVTAYCEMSPVELEVGAKRCNAGEYSMCVEPNGDVLPCQSYYVSAGNILRDPWPQIWKGALFRSFREREEDPVFAGLPEMCHECPDLPLCGGGCRIERESREGVAPGGCQSCASGGGCSTKSRPGSTEQVPARRPTQRSTGVSATEGRHGLPVLRRLPIAGVDRC